MFYKKKELNNITASFCKVQCRWKFLKTTSKEEGIFRVITWIVIKISKYERGEFHVKMVKKAGIFWGKSFFDHFPNYIEVRKFFKVIFLKFITPIMLIDRLLIACIVVGHKNYGRWTLTRSVKWRWKRLGPGL